MSDLICDVIIAVFCVIRVKSTHLIKLCLKTRKREKIWKWKKFLH